MNIGTVSYSLAAIGYFVLAGLMAVSWRGRPLGGLVILAALVMALWGLLSALYSGGGVVSPLALQGVEFVRNVSWFLLLANMLSLSGENQEASLSRKFYFSSLAAILVTAFLLFVLPLSDVFAQYASLEAIADIRLLIWLCMPLLGLLLVEQVFRNSSSTERWVIRYLCIGVGLIFVYDFFMYADALLYKRISPAIWQSRGLIVALAVPMIAVAIARNPRYDIRIHVSRNMVFHSATVMGAGVYLLLMAVGGYFLQLSSTSFGGVFQIVFLFGAGVLLAVLLFSDSIRAKSKVFLSKHFFSYKHDYREQWLQFTQAMSRDSDDVPVRIIRAVSGLVESGGGVLFEGTGHNQFRVVDRYDMAEVEGANSRDLEPLFRFLSRDDWVVDFDEFRQNPEIYGDLVLPQWLSGIADAWLIVPLNFKAEIIGFVLIKRSGTVTTINWEDLDLLKMAGKQAAIHLAQFRADKSLMEAHQFDSFNRLSAYVVHDLKNILAQQSLMLSNAEKHRNNPAFVDDVFLTIGNSVERMTRLMEQMRDGARGEKSERIELFSVLSEVVQARSGFSPVPSLRSFSDVVVNADRSQLVTIFSHLIQNAQEATLAEGEVSMCVEVIDGQVLINVEDSGKGMSDEFIRERLFKPFDSTKGLMGMGIGVYESREFVRSMGGDISVKSAPGHGTLFKVSLPQVSCKAG